MEKLINQTIFQCSYCTRISKSAAGMNRHEISCKKNPCNQSLCASCKHLKKEVRHGKARERCSKCPRRHIELDEYARPIYTTECNLFYEGVCDGSQKYVDFICVIDACKMYSNKIHRLSSEKANNIKQRCDRPMANAATGCDNYEYDEEL